MIKTMLKTLVACLMIALFVWFMASWFEVVLKNSAPNAQYSMMNLFQIICK